MKNYTVVGYYTDNDQRYCEHVTARSPKDAESAIAEHIEEHLDVVICGVFDNHIYAADEEDYVKTVSGAKKFEDKAAG